MKCRNSILLSYYEFIIISISSVVPCIVFFSSFSRPSTVTFMCGWYVALGQGYETNVLLSRGLPVFAYATSVRSLSLLHILSVSSFLHSVNYGNWYLVNFSSIFCWLFEDSFCYDCGIFKSEWLTDVN